jgi:epoxyqueuosine reductase
MDPTAELAALVRREAREAGFQAVGITRPDPSEHGAFYRGWLDEGFHGDMAYLAREDAVERRKDPRRSFDTARSIIVVADGYGAREQVESPERGIVARYARGEDYHRVVHRGLSSLLRALDEHARRLGIAEGVTGRVYVDTGPLLERELGRRAGLGWFGRNTMLIDPRRGSYFVLGALLVDVELPVDAPFDADRCGSCRACLDACPTDALLGRDENGAPVLDATRCISYWTIEARGPIPPDLRPAFGNRVFGCDICQEVCPWTRKFAAAHPASDAYEPRAWPADDDADPPLPSLDGPDLVEFTERVLAMSGKEYGRVFADSPLSRPGRKVMLRNLCVALGNWGATSPEAAARVRPLLARAAEDRSELVRDHAAWGLRGGGDSRLDL